MSSTEPLLQDNPNRFVIFPIQHHDIWEWYKKMEASFYSERNNAKFLSKK